MEKKNPYYLLHLTPKITINLLGIQKHESKTTIKNGTHIFILNRCLVRAACTFGRNPSTRRSNCQSTSSNFWNFGLLVLLGGWWLECEDYFSGEPLGTKMERICQNCTSTVYRILYKIDSEIVGIAMSAGNTHNPFMVVFVRISDSRSTSTMSSRRLPELQLNLCDSMAANADRPKYNGACTNLPEHVSEAVQVHSWTRQLHHLEKLISWEGSSHQNGPIQTFKMRY